MDSVTKILWSLFPFESKFLIILEMIGLIVFVYIIFNFFKSIYIYFLRSSYNLLKRYGKGYALVTGGTDGIGLSYCFELARRGFNLVILSRNIEKLNLRKTEILQRYPNIDIKVKQIDFAYIKDEELIQEISLIGSSTDISLIVNNVGGYFRKCFGELSLNEIRDMIQKNAVAHIVITKALINQLLKRPTRSGIIFISSLMSSGIAPYTSLYGSSKSFVNVFAKTISLEYKEKIDVTSFRVGGVNTNLNTTNKWYNLNPHNLPYHHLSFLGHTSMTCGHWFHALSKFGIDYLFGKFIIKNYATLMRNKELTKQKVKSE